jgi:uncharacterized OB-fold protein
MSDAIPPLLPELTQENSHFWQGGRDGRLVMLRCGNCSLWIHPEAPICRRCLSRNVAPQATSGRGTVATFTVNHQQWFPGLETPYVVAIVELNDQAGLRMMTNIVGCEPSAVRIGAPVHVVFEQHDDVWLPLFELDASTQSLSDGSKVPA